MAWEVRLNDKHPVLSFRRDGIVFTKNKPVILEKLSETLQKELSLPNTPLEAVRIEDKITALEKEINRYEEKIEPDRETYLSPLRSIRAYCIQCCGGSQKAPRKCASKNCPLFVFRLGKYPARSGKGGKGNTDNFKVSEPQNLRKKGIVGVAGG